MTPPHGSSLSDLTDSDPNLPAVDAEIGPQQLVRDAGEPATVASVREAIRHHLATCPAPRKLHRWTKLACVMIGVGLALQVVLAVAGRSILRETVRTAVREEMGKMAAVEQPQWPALVPSAFAKGPTP